MLLFGDAKTFICRVEFVINRRLETYTSCNNSGNLIGYIENVGRVAQWVRRLTTGWTVRGSNPGGARFSARPDRPWCPPSCTMGTGSFRGVKYGRGVLVTTQPLLVLRSWKSRAILLPTLWTTTGSVMGTL